MAKLIGTGKDPRFPQGQDYDVNENDLEHHIQAGLGEPVEPGTEAYAVHRGYDTLAADPGEHVGVPAEQSQYGGASRVASRVETTAFEGDAVGAEEAVAKAQEGRTEEEDAGDAVDPEAGVQGARAADKSGAEEPGAEPQTGDHAPEGPAGPGDGSGEGTHED